MINEYITREIQQDIYMSNPMRVGKNHKSLDNTSEFLRVMVNNKSKNWMNKVRTK